MLNNFYRLKEPLNSGTDDEADPYQAAVLCITMQHPKEALVQSLTALNNKLVYIQADQGMPTKPAKKKAKVQHGQMPPPVCRCIKLPPPQKTSLAFLRSSADY